MDDVIVAQKLLNIYRSAKSRNIDFDLSFKKVKQLLQTKKCFFTGEELIIGEHADGEQPKPNSLTFDRLDNSKGYTDDNVVACTHAFNQKKGNLEVEDILNIYNAFKRKKIVK